MKIFLGNMDHTFSGGGRIGTGHQKSFFISPQELGFLIPTENIVAFADGATDFAWHNQKQNNNTCAAPQQGWVEVQPLPSPGPTTIPQHGYLVLSISSSWLCQNCFFIVFFFIAHRSETPLTWIGSQWPWGGFYSTLAPEYHML